MSAVPTQKKGKLMMKYAAGTQKAKILNLFKYGPICSSLLFESRRLGVTHRLAARIHEMRADGLTIETRPCVNVYHGHKAGMVEYVLNGSER